MIDDRAGLVLRGGLLLVSARRLLVVALIAALIAALIRGLVSCHGDEKRTRGGGQS